MPLAVVERQAQAEYQRVPLSGVWVPWSKRLTAWTTEPSLNSTMQAAVTGPGRCPPPSKWMVANSIT
jgi:hypothetical protein